MHINTTRFNAGDTLVEVMIALAIIGSVIAISYSTASRSLRVGRQAQERVEALKLAEGQVESLKLIGNNGDPLRTQLYSSVYSRTSGAPRSFCILVGGAPTIQAQTMIADTLEADPLTFGPIPAVYNTACAVGVDQRYKLSIERSDSGAFPNILSTFTIRARWLRLGGGTDEVAISYRMHQGQF